MGSDDLPPFTWRACWRLCLPALVVAVVVRFMVCLALPEAYYGSDSNSYFDTANDLWNHGKFGMGAKRRGLYPLLLTVAPALPANTPQVIAVFQHGLSVVALLGVGWVTGHVTRRRAFWVPVVTCIAAVLPQPLWYEHEIIADSLVVQSFIAAVALAFPTDRLRGRRLMWFLIAAAAIVACKPHGRPLWFGLVCSAVLLAGNPLRWGWPCHVVLGVTLVIILGTGSSKQGSWLLMSSALPLIDTEKGKWPEYRRALRPLVTEAREDLANYPWRQGRFKKRVKEREDLEAWKDSPEWRRLLSSQDKFSKVAKTFAVQAIIKHPVIFAGFVIKKLGMVLSADDVDTKFQPESFWHEQSGRNEGRWERDPRELELLYEMKKPEYAVLEKVRPQNEPRVRPTWLERTRHLHWVRRTHPAGDHRDLSLTWAGGLGLLGLCWCLSPGHFRGTSPLWLPCFVYLGIIYTVGDAVRRYLIPIEWLLLLFMVLGIEWVIDLLLRLFRRRGEMPAMTPVPAQ